MRVKIGDTWYDAEDVPICIQMTEDNLAAIQAMSVESSPQLKYAVFPEDAFKTTKQIMKWMSK